jgi:hypothetical protein
MRSSFPRSSISTASTCHGRKSKLTIPDKQLAGLGVKRRSSVRMPYFGAALSCLPGSELILTLTNGMREMVERNSTLRLVKAPRELRPFHFLMVWHPRLTTDARHMAARGDASGFS